MEVLQAFKYARKDTLIDELDPRTKFIVSVLTTLASLICFSLTAQIILLTIVFLLILVSKRATQWIKSLKGLAILVALIFVLNLITTPGFDVLYSSIMALRFLVITASFSFFFLTTTPDDLATALEEIKVPREYSLLFTLSFRFVPTLAGDVETISDALKSRGFELEKGSFIQRIKNYAYLLIPLIVYEIRRSLMIAEALEARAFGATKKPTRITRLKMNIRDYVFVTIFLAITLIIYRVASTYP